jgi:hypothetical protein
MSCSAVAYWEELVAAICEWGRRRETEGQGALLAIGQGQEIVAEDEKALSEGGRVVVAADGAEGHGTWLGTEIDGDGVVAGATLDGEGEEVGERNQQLAGKCAHGFRGGRRRTAGQRWAEAESREAAKEAGRLRMAMELAREILEDTASAETERERARWFLARQERRQGRVN